MESEGKGERERERERGGDWGVGVHIEFRITHKAVWNTPSALSIRCIDPCNDNAVLKSMGIM